MTNLATALVANGFTPWRCEVDIDIGENFVAKINDGLAQSQIALVIWSPDAARSAWTKEEWAAALLQRVEGQKMRLGLIMLRDHADYPLPPLLRTTNFIDARWDQAAAIRETITWLKGRQSLQRLSGSKAPIYLPEYRQKDFVGRSLYLAKLRDEYFPEPGKFLLYGEPGAGKSSIALQFAWDAQKDLDAVIWQTCGQRPLDAITSELVERLPIDVKTLAPVQQRIAAKEWLRERQSLLVLDDVWSSDVIELEPKGACSVLYTSRRQSLRGLATKQISKVEKFTAAEAEELFHTYLDPAFSKDAVEKNRQPLLDFAARVEMLPIAVAVGASLLRENTAVPLGKAVSKLKLSALNDGAKNVNLLFGQAIESQPARELKLLAACAVCVQEGFWLPLAAQIADLSEDDADEAASVLVRGSLLRVLDRDRRRFQLHALLRDQLRARAGADGLSDLQERHAAVLEELFKDWETRWQDCRECLEEILPAAQFLWTAEEISRQAWVTVWGYLTAQRIGEMNAALRILQQEESFWRGRDDRAAKDALQRTYGNQALILQDWGRLDEALALHKKQEAICLELGNKDSLQISYGNQANILIQQKKLTDASALLRKQEAICIELGNKNNLGYCYWIWADLEAAQGDGAAQTQKLQQALALFTELNMPRQRDAVQAELDQLTQD